MTACSAVTYLFAPLVVYTPVINSFASCMNRYALAFCAITLLRIGDYPRRASLPFLFTFIVLLELNL